MIGEEEYIAASASGDISKMVSGDSPPLKPSNVMALQRQLGNQATINIVNRKLLSRKQNDAQPFANLKMVTSHVVQRDPQNGDDVVEVNKDNIDEKVDFKINGGGAKQTDTDTPQGEDDIELDADDANDDAITQQAIDQVEGEIEGAQNGTTTPDDEISDEDDEDDFDDANATTTGGDVEVEGAPTGGTTTPDDEISDEDDEDDFDDVNATTTGGSSDAPAPPADPNFAPDAAMIKDLSQPQPTPQLETQGGLGGVNAINNNRAVEVGDNDNPALMATKLIRTFSTPIHNRNLKNQIAHYARFKSGTYKIPLNSHFRTQLKRINEYYDLKADGIKTLDTETQVKLKSAINNSPHWKGLVGSSQPDQMEFATRIEGISGAVDQSDKLNKSKKDQKDKVKGYKKAWQDGSMVKSAAVEAGAGFSIERAVNFIKQIADGVKEVNYWDFAVDTLMGVMGKITSLVTIGVAVYKLAVQLRRRNNAYFEGMLKAGFTNKTDPDKEQKQAKTKDAKAKGARGRIAQFGYRKTWKATVNVVIRLATTMLSWLMGIITLLTGGAAAMPAGIVALAANMTNVMRVIVNKGLGLKKFFQGKRGYEREQNARELLIQAMRGDDEAIDLIWAVDPFDHIQVVTKTVGSSAKYLFTFGYAKKPITVLIQPASKEQFKAELMGQKEGLYATKAAQEALANALKASMKSTA